MTNSLVKTSKFLRLVLLHEPARIGPTLDAAGWVAVDGSQPGKHYDLVIPQQCVLEIQYELAKHGFYDAESNGLYDETTVQAMWEFQKNYGLPATGYPTAHSLNGSA